VQAAFHVAASEHGHGGYTATIAEKHNHVVITRAASLPRRS
jgi:hypothetical protein